MTKRFQMGWMIVLSLAASMPAWAGEPVTVTPYGYIKGTVAYDTARTSPGNFVLSVNSFDPDHPDDQLSITANETRVGMNFKGPEAGPGITTSGKIEVDFYGSGSAENKSGVMLRHAYLELSLPDQWSVIAGQTWDLMFNQFPQTVNYSVAWNAGNIGYRRPQIRGTKAFTLGEQSKLAIKLALARNIGNTAITASGGDTGRDAAVPVVEGCVEYTFPMMGKSALVALSGHWGKEEYDTDALNTHDLVDSWSGVIDVKLPLVSSLELKAKAWKGTNMQAYLGGIGQGVRTSPLEPINARGGWVGLSYGPVAGATINTGATMDTAQEDQLATAGKSQNTSIFANVFYGLTSNLTLAGEVTQWRTQYKNQNDGQAWRYEAAMIYKF